MKTKKPGAGTTYNTPTPNKTMATTTWTIATVSIKMTWSPTETTNVAKLAMKNMRATKSVTKKGDYDKGKRDENVKHQYTVNDNDVNDENGHNDYEIW